MIVPSTLLAIHGVEPKWRRWESNPRNVPPVPRGRLTHNFWKVERPERRATPKPNPRSDPGTTAWQAHGSGHRMASSTRPLASARRGPLDEGSSSSSLPCSGGRRATCGHRSRVTPARRGLIVLTATAWAPRHLTRTPNESAIPQIGERAAMFVVVVAGADLAGEAGIWRR